MAEFLTFVLAAPLGAMGALAVGERRGAWDRPGRSAVLGLIAGCLGLDRAAEADHAALSAGFGLAIRREGGVTPLLSDYHTAQTAPTRRNRSFATRREQLAIPKHEQETVLTRRDYRADIAFTIVLWRRGDSAPWTLDALAEVLSRPCFIPYLGRKSCPLGLPMAPLIVTAATVREAFEARDSGARAIEREALARPGGGTLWADHGAEGEPELGLDEARSEVRRDEPISRARWQFGLREEIVADWPARGAAG
jgi:CRISPR system Cascade subunit CasD